MEFKLLAIPVALLAIFVYFKSSTETDNKMERAKNEYQIKSGQHALDFKAMANGEEITVPEEAIEQMKIAKEKLKKYEGRSIDNEKKVDAVQEAVDQDIEKALKGAK